MFDLDCYQELDKKDSAWVWAVTVIVLSVMVIGFLGFVIYEDDKNVATNNSSQERIEQVRN